MATKSLTERILGATKTNETGCWIWQLKLHSQGYARMSVNGRGTYVHRLSYQIWIGPIAEGLQIDHLCRVRSCCNPWHLEAVTPRTNSLRGESVAARAAKVKQCPHGHPYEGSNLIIKKDGSRGCRECHRDGGRRYSEKLRAQGIPTNHPTILAHVPPAERVAAYGTPNTHCRKGHPYAGENLIINTQGYRVCRTCTNIRQRKDYTTTLHL
jgi:hypothetical protein